MANAVSDLASIKPLEEALSQKRQARESAFTPMQESLTAKGEIEAAQKKQTAEATAEMEKAITGEQERYAQRAAEAPQRGERAKVAEGLERPFIPTQDNMRDMAGLFSLINVVGFAMGRGGKQNAVQAMNAMNGMLEGYQQGREDLYKKEKGQFELNLKRLKQQMDTLDKQLKDALQTYATDRDAGIQKARAAFAQAGADFYKQYEEKYGLAATYEYHKQIYAAAEKAEQTALGEYERAREKADAERRHRESMAASLQRTQMQITAADERARLAREAKVKPSGELPKDKETNNEHRFRHSAMITVQEVLDDLKNPEIRRLIGPQNQYMPDVILNLQDKYPALAQKLARFQSEEFKIGGKALTASEQKILGPIYNWRGLTAKALEDNLKEAERTMDKEQTYLENRYPGLKAFDYGSAGAVPSFSSVEEAEAAGLDPGTQIKINGRSAVVE